MRYLKNNYKKMIRPTLFLALLGFVIYVLPIVFTNPESEYTGRTNLTLLSVSLTAMAIFIPIYEFQALKNKRGADMYYSLPLNKRQLYLHLYLKGLIELLIAYTITFILGVIIISTKNFNLSMIYYIPLYFSLTVTLIGYYSFNVFIFSKANRLLDGIVLIGLYIVSPILFAGALNGISSIPIISPHYVANASPLSVIYQVTTTFQLLIVRPFPKPNFLDGGHMFVYAWVIIHYLSLVLVFLVKRFEKPENVNQLSDSYFSYKTIIPITMASSILFITSGSSMLIYLPIVLMFILVAYCGYVIFERTFKLRLYSWITLITVSVLSILALEVIRLLQ